MSVSQSECSAGGGITAQRRFARSAEFRDFPNFALCYGPSGVLHGTPNSEIFPISCS